MTPPPAVSVLMPVLNPHPVYFPEAVASIIGQTFTDWELVIVEDPSPSSAAELLKRFDDPRIRLITNPNRTSFAGQLNQGIGECRADLLARMDADDIANPTRLAKQVSFLGSTPDVSVVGCQLSIIDQAGAEIGSRKYPTTYEAILRMMPRYNAIPHPGVAARTDAILRQGGYGFKWPLEDYDLWSRMLIAGERFANIDEPLVQYRVHPQSGSKSRQLRETLRYTLEVKRTHWWKRMTWRDRLRYRAEQVLLSLPPHWVLFAFKLVTYRRTSGASAVSENTK